MATIGTLKAHVLLDTHGMGSQIRATNAQIDSMGTTMQRTGARMKSSLAGMTKMLGAFGIAMGGGMMATSISRTGAQFGQTMAVVRGVTRATADEFVAMEAEARRMGETTEWTATQAAQSLQFLGMAGFSASKAVTALPGTLDLATAGNIDLGRAADIATNALTAMGLPVQQLSRVNDVFVGTITRSNTNMEMMAESFKYSAPVARAFGYSIEDLSGLIGQLGNAGIQGSMAGTQLSMAFMKSAEIAKKFGYESDELLSVLDNMRRDGFEATEVIAEFGQRAGRAAGVLFELTSETREFQGTLRGTQGEAKRLADVMRNTVMGKFKELKSVIESIGIDTFKRYENALRNMIQSTINWLRDNRTEIVNMLAGVAHASLQVLKVVGGVTNAVWTLMRGLGVFSIEIGSQIQMLDGVMSKTQLADRLSEIDDWTASRRLGESILAFFDDMVKFGNSVAQFFAKTITTTINSVAGLFEYAYNKFRLLGRIIQETARLIGMVRITTNTLFDAEERAKLKRDLEEQVKLIRLMGEAYGSEQVRMLGTGPGGMPVLWTGLQFPKQEQEAIWAEYGQDIRDIFAQNVFDFTDPQSRARMREQAKAAREWFGRYLYTGGVPGMGLFTDKNAATKSSWVAPPMPQIDMPQIGMQDFGTYLDGLREMQEETSELQRLTESWGSGFVSALMDMNKNGSNAFHSLAQSIAHDLAMLILKTTALAQLWRAIGLMGKGGKGGTLQPYFHGSGPGGLPIVHTDAGPTIQGMGMGVPRYGDGGGSGGVTVEINNKAGEQVAVSQQQVGRDKLEVTIESKIYSMFEGTKMNKTLSQRGMKRRPAVR